MRYVWQVDENGFFSNLRFVPDDYVLAENEREGEGDTLPRFEDLPGFIQPPPPVPDSISRRQFFQVAAMKGMITQQEALDAVRTGAIPALMQQGLDTLSPDDKFAAEMMLSGSGEFERHHPLVEKFGEVMGMPSTALDDIWREGAKL